MPSRSSARPTWVSRLLVDRLARLRREEVVAAAVGIEARRQAVRGEHLQQRAKGRGRAFLLDQKRRVDRAGRVVHRHDQVERRLARKPRRARAVLMQHHALARLALALATMRSAPPAPARPARPCATASSPRCSPTGTRDRAPGARENASRSSPDSASRYSSSISRPHRRRHPLRRRLAEPSVDKPFQPVLLVAVAGSAGTAAPTSPAARPPPASTAPPPPSGSTRPRNFCILRSCSHAVRFIAPLLCGAQNRTTRVLPNPDNSCAYDSSGLTYGEALAFRLTFDPASFTRSSGGLGSKFMIRLMVNGQSYDVDVEPDTPLLWAIRENVGLTGTKYGCGIAQCGSCTVHIDGEAQRSCRLPPSRMWPARRSPRLKGSRGNHQSPGAISLDRSGHPQCGYCQSGQIMTAVAGLLRRHPHPTPADVDAAMSDNICRCGTYQRVRAGIHAAAAKACRRPP